MRLGVVSDVHGNMIALETVVHELEHGGVDRVVALGDMIQGGPQPAEVARRLAELGWPVVMGNSDAWLLTGEETGREEISEERLRKLHLVRDWSLSRLSTKDREFIQKFQPTVAVDLGDGRGFLGFHGSPLDYDQLIFPHTPEAEFRELLQPFSDRILAGGHVHLPFVRRIADSLFFNPGSVGLAYDQEQDEAAFRLDPWAEFAVLTVERGRVGLEFRRVGYDVPPLLQAYRESGRPFAEELIAQYGGG